MRLRLLPWLAVFTALGLGCRALVDLEGLTDGKLTQDGGPPAGDSGPRDGAVTSDAGADAVVEAGPTFCQTAPGPRILCEDFEQPNLQVWSITSKRGLGSVDTTRGATSQASFRAHFDSPVGSDSYVAWVSSVKAPDTATTTILEAKYWFDAAPASHIETSTVVIDAGVTHYVFFTIDKTMQLSLDHEHDPIGGGGAYYAKGYPTGQTIPLKRWVKLRIEIDPRTPAARGYVDDALVVQQTLENTLGPGPSQATLGGWMPEAPTPFDMWTDDILFRAQ